MSGETTSRFFRSAGAATFSQAWRVGVTFGVTLFLRRLVPQGDWGLWEWAVVVFLIFGALRDLGLVYHVVRLKERPYGNLLVLEAGWGAALAGVVFVAAPWIGLAFKDAHPDKIAVLRALCLFLFFEGLASVPRVYFENELAIGRTVLPEILRNLIFAATSVAMAFAGFGIWSLLTAQVVCTAYYAAHLWVRARPAMRLEFAAGGKGWGTWGLVRNSVPLALIWFLVILTRYVDPLILGAQFSKETVASYAYAYFVAFLITTTLVPAVTRALYPALVAYSDDPRRLLQAFRLATLFVLALEAPIAFFLFANPELTVRILGGRQWVDTPGFLEILCFAPLVDPFTRLGGEVLKVYHHDRLWILSSSLTLLCFLAFGIAFTMHYGPVGMAWANFLPLGGVLMARGLWRIDAASFRELCRDIAIVYLIPVLPLLALRFALPGSGALRFGLSLAAMAAVFAIYARLFGPLFVRFLRDPVEAVKSAGDA
jgi:PST family polysaccharide transporter